MKRGTLFLSAFVALLAFPAAAFLGQTAIPTISYDAVDFLKPPANLAIGEVAGVASNSKGQVFVYTRTGTVNVSVGTARAFAHGPSRLLEFDQNGKFVKEIGEGVYALTYAQSVRVDRQDNIWIVDQYSNMAVKFDPEGRVLLTFGRRPETAGSVLPAAPAAAPGGGAGRGAAGPATGAAAGPPRGAGEVPAAPAGAGRGGGAPAGGGAGRGG